jgi:uncharacterized membrane protein
MKNIYWKIAAILAWVIGVMAILAGGPVLLGRNPGYNVIGWVPVYNLVMGAVSVFLVGILLWKGSRWALPAALATFGIHAFVMLILLTAFREVVATASLAAMVIRLIVWGIILILLCLGTRAAPNRDVSAAG